jgi:DNA-binding GntR family transcriptional regulator
MPLDPAIFAPFEKPEGRRAVVEIHDILRDLILSGRLAPGTILSQVELSRILGVSRTPVREALRRLQEGDLISAEPNFRCRVLGFDPDEVEALYMKRILVESFGVAITALRMTTEQLKELERVVHALEGEEAHSSFETWLSLHRKFHHLITQNAGAPFAADIDLLERRSERYQSAYKGAHLPGWWMRGEVEHREIFDALASHDAARASELSARHLARTALELLAALAPEHDSSTLRMSLQHAIGATKSLAAEKPAFRSKRAAAR